MAKEQDIQRPVQQIDPIKEEESSRRIRGTTSAIPTDTGRSWERVDFPETSSPKEIDEVDFSETSSPKEIYRMEDPCESAVTGAFEMALPRRSAFPPLHKLRDVQSAETGPIQMALLELNSIPHLAETGPIKMASVQSAATSPIKMASAATGPIQMASLQSAETGPIKMALSELISILQSAETGPIKMALSELISILQSAETGPIKVLNGTGPTRYRGADKYMDLDLYRAAAHCDVNVFDQQVRTKVLSQLDILKWVSPFGNTLLHVAASYRNEAIVSLIASKYCSFSLLTKKNSKGDTALHIAAKAGDVSIVRILVDIQIDFPIPPRSKSPSGETSGEEGSDVPLLRIKNEEANTALHEALINRQESVAEKLIQADREVSYYINNQGKSPLYLAVEAGYRQCVSHMLAGNENENICNKLEGKSPVHAAVVGRNEEMLDFILKTKPGLIHLKGDDEMTPLHWASSIGYLPGVQYLLGKYPLDALCMDKNGFFPIHMASFKGHVHVIQNLLEHCPHPLELLDDSGRNILHVAAQSGQHDVVRYILKNRQFEKLINEKDKNGNTPLHLATFHGHPKIVSALTWDKRVDSNLENKDGKTAFDAAGDSKQRIPTFRQRLTWEALKAAGAKQASSRKDPNAKPPDVDYLKDYIKDMVNTFLLVSTLVATITFAAGFTMPGGYNSSDPDQGMATMLRHNLFHMFVFCNTIAMYSSITVAVSLIWALLGDLKVVLTALRFAVPLLGIALTMMSLAFMAGVSLVVSKLSWLANAILIMGSVFLVTLSVLFFLLCFPLSYRHPILRYVSYYPFCLLVWATGSYTKSNLEDEATTLYNDPPK